ncbi:uncharacterized protein [Amphiura filiformis]|uniref:uncharacterized protein n=1 Tax=Amphiura filiformis TaxID=82378 RepID=UPI003B20E5B5
MVEDTSVKGDVKLQLQMASNPGPKTVFTNQNSAGNLVTIFAEQSKKSTENKTIRRTLPGKSHVSRIILHDNTSQERLLDMKLAEIRHSQRKMDAFMSHQKKTFMKRMEKKHSNWAREHTRQAAEFNSKGTRSIGYMLEMMRANPERYGGGDKAGKAHEMVGDSVTGQQIEDEDEQQNKLPDLNDKDYTNVMSQARIPERKLKHRTTGIPSLPTLFTLPDHIAYEQDDQNSFLTAHHDNEMDIEVDEDHILQVQKSNTRVSFSSDVKQSVVPDEDTYLPALGSLRKASFISTRSHTAPRESIIDKLPSVSRGSHGNHRPETEPCTDLYPARRHRKKTKNPPRLPGPEPTFISESLPRIDTSDPNVIKLQNQHQTKKSRRAKRKARAKEANRREASRNPLNDERFVKLQSYLSPVPSEQESRDIVKRLGRKQSSDFMDSDFEDDEDELV